MQNGSYQNQIEIRSPKKKYYLSNEIFTILDDIIPILDWTTRNNLYHCDLKPANILIKLDGRPKIADFGESIRLASDAENSNIKGTPAFYSYRLRSACNVYKSTGRVPDFKHDQEKSDVLSLGITLIDMCLLKVVHGINHLDTYLQVQK